VPLGGSVKLEKGSTWVLDIDNGEIVSGRYVSAPK
jgi:hypothetical protein